MCTICLFWNSKKNIKIIVITERNRYGTEAKVRPQICESNEVHIWQNTHL